MDPARAEGHTSPATTPAPEISIASGGDEPGSSEPIAGGAEPSEGSAMIMTAAILLIGNEILSGKVDDENARYLVRELRSLGVAVGRIEIVPDVLDDIAATVRALAARFDVVFTSGGVGPTHDDVTLPAVAAAFQMPIVRHPELERLLRGSFGDRLHDRDLRMADVPSGARLEYGPGGPTTAPGRRTIWPVIVVGNVWILPGVPSIFRRKFEAVRELFRASPIHTRAVYSREGEGAIAAVLDQVVNAFPAVDVGSYPHLDAPDYRVKITLDGRDRAAVDDAAAMLLARLGAAVVRSE
jgi:molybdenum cofactor synthesis domain-containing protein